MSALFATRITFFDTYPSSQREVIALDKRGYADNIFSSPESKAQGELL